MMTDDQIIEVVRAHRDGKIIQWCNADKSDWADYQICCFKDSGLNFDFIHYDYRIKPESKFRPYVNAEEFLMTDEKLNKHVQDQISKRKKEQEEKNRRIIEAEETASRKLYEKLKKRFG